VEPKVTISDDAYAVARRRWPNIALAPERFRARVAEMGIDEGRILSRAADLYLVAAVLEGAPGAITELDALLQEVIVVIARVDGTSAFVEDVKQELRIKLLTGAEPRIGTYSGLGGLVEWLRVVALRIAINLKRGDRLHPTAEVPEAVLGGQESAQLRRWYLEDFQSALEAGFRRLSARERTLVRLHFVDRLNIDRMGTIYGVNRATVARWLVNVRRRLFDEVRAELGDKHGLDTADIKSLYRLLQSDVHVTVSRILQE
jgi:RNA polymerase sigma-70 factor (ECF subfamily)